MVFCELCYFFSLYTRTYAAVIVSSAEDVELHENNMCAPPLQIYENFTPTPVPHLDHLLFRTSGKPEPVMVMITSKKKVKLSLRLTN
jgi:hypothetical protein